ncbi:unnamed protein product [Caenorhabditis sp. 36 PRJEB53466]|nr:unnamed protein product [Caenorhabditis sp. 36 PRJEB53466]
MNEKTLNHVLNHFLTRYKSIQGDQSPEILEKLTLTQYTNLARIDVETSADLFGLLNRYMSDYLEVLHLEEELKRKKCLLAQSLKTLDDKFSKAAEKTKERNEKLKTDDIDFLQSKIIVDKPTFAKPVEPKKPTPLVEPTYSTRVIREKVSAPQPVFDSIMKPPTYSSNMKFAKSEKKENMPTKQLESFNLDDSLINDPDFSVVNENLAGKLKFDEMEDEEKTPARGRKAPARPEKKPLDLSSMPPPPVFSSSTGRAFNQK